MARPHSACNTLVIAFLLVALLPWGIEAATMRDDRGKSIHFATPPKRVVILNNSLVDLWYECGGSVVGRPFVNSAPLPAQAMKAPEIGHMTNPNVEKILALQPDLVIAYHGLDAHDRLLSLFEGAGIATASVELETFADYISLSERFSLLLGKDTSRADAPWKVVKNKVAQQLQKKHATKPKVLILFGSPKDVSVRLEDSQVGSMVKNLGAINIAQQPGLRSDMAAQFSLERVVEQDPDIVLIQCMGDEKQIGERIAKQMGANPAWKSVKAVRSGQVHMLPKEFFLYKPNAHWADAYAYLENILYPQGQQ